MNIPRTVLVLSSAVFAVLGGVFTILPDRMAALVDISLTSDVARTDLMATYGGFELGFAAFLAMCATQAPWVRPGLIASGCALAGFASVRLIGILMSAELSPLMPSILIAEAAGSAMSFWAAGRAAGASASVRG